MLEKAKELIITLNFEKCIELFDKLENGHPMIDLVFDRMEEIDPKRFEEWL